MGGNWKALKIKSQCEEKTDSRCSRVSNFTDQKEHINISPKPQASSCQSDGESCERDAFIYKGSVKSLFNFASFSCFSDPMNHISSSTLFDSVS
jgi:hypothetical protein